MKAIIYTKYWSLEVLQIKEIIKLTPEDNKIPVKAHVTAVTGMRCENVEFPCFY